VISFIILKGNGPLLKGFVRRVTSQNYQNVSWLRALLAQKAYKPARVSALNKSVSQKQQRQRPVQVIRKKNMCETSIENAKLKALFT